MIQQLLAQLEAYNRIYNNEKEMVSLIEEFVCLNGERAFLRHNYPVHITASGWIFNETLNKVLLIYHKKLDKLLQPGGHCEIDDLNLQMTALREVKEETGLTNIVPASEEIYHIDIHSIPKSNSEIAHFHYDICYSFIALSEQIDVAARELEWARWYEAGKLEKLRIDDKALCNMIKKQVKLRKL